MVKDNWWDHPFWLSSLNSCSRHPFFSVRLPILGKLKKSGSESSGFLLDSEIIFLESISGDNVQDNPQIISYLALQARGSASGYSSDNDSEEPIPRWPIRHGSDEAGPSRPVRSCHTMCPVHCPLHPSSNLRRVQSHGGIPRFGEWHENFGGGLERPVRALPILPDPESHPNYNVPQNPNANDKKGRRFPWFKKSWFKKRSWFKK